MPAVTPQVNREIDAMRGGGAALDDGMRAQLEPHYNADLGSVRVHSGTRAAAAAESLEARAFTVGGDIFFGRGQYAPQGGDGRRLLAHELTHVVQQGAAGARVQRKELVTFHSAAAFLTNDTTVGDAAIKILKATKSYKKIVADISVAMRAAYGREIPVHLHQFLGIPGNEVLCGDDAAGCCRNCEQGCEGLGIEQDPGDFQIFSELFSGGFSKGLAVPENFRVSNWDSPEVATASVMFHELLHLWFYQYGCVYKSKLPDKDFPDTPSGHSGDKKIYYDPVFAAMWQQAQTEIEAEWTKRHPALDGGTPDAGVKAAPDAGRGGADGGMIRREPDPAASPTVATTPTKTPTATSEVRLQQFRAAQPAIATEVIGCSRLYRSLVDAVDPLLEQAGAYKRHSIEVLAEPVWRERVFTTERNFDHNEFDAPHLSEWLETFRHALQLLLTIERSVVSNPDMAFWTGETEKLLARAVALYASPYMQDGVERRERERLQAEHQARIDAATDYITNYLEQYWEPDLADIVSNMYGVSFAVKLVQTYHLNGEDIRTVFDTLRERDPRLLEAALFRGSTVRTLLEMKIGGMQAYYAGGEGFTSGLIRGEAESRLQPGPDNRHFDLGDKAIATLGFIAGMFQGVGDSIISNVKGIIDLFTPTFWHEMYQLVTDFVPKFIDNESFRFQLGQMMGQFSVAEERRLATAEPLDYGLTIGHLFGMAITEIVLSFVGLGFVLKAVEATPRLAKISKVLASLAEKLSELAVIKRGISVITGIGEALNAFERRLQRLRNLLPDLTPNQRLRRVLFEMEEADRQTAALMARAEASYNAARAALAKGDHAGAEAQLEELSRTVEELEKAAPDEAARARKAAAGEPEPHEPKRHEGPEPVGGQKRFEQWEQTVDGETRTFLEEHPGVEKRYEEMEPAVRDVCTHCGSLCILTDIESVSRSDISRVIKLIERLGGADHIGPEVLTKLKIYFHVAQGDLAWTFEMMKRIETTEDLDRFLIMSFRRRAMEHPGMVRANQKVARVTAGMASGGERLPIITNGSEWLAHTEHGVGLIPAEIAQKLRNRQFNNIGEFREAFWKEVGNSTVLSSDFKPDTIERMKNGLAPWVGGDQYKRKPGQYALHHITPVENGGGVYDLDNIVVVSPYAHADIHGRALVNSPINQKPVVVPSEFD